VSLAGPDLLIPPTRCVFLVRHGRTPLNASSRLRGHLNPALDDVGRSEVSALAAELADHQIVKIVTSPLLRALQTAEAIAGATGAPTAANPGLVDRDYGEWAGEPEANVVQRWGTVGAAPGVESIVSLRRRAWSVLEAQTPLLEKGNVVLVTHDAVLQVLLGDLGVRRADGPIRLPTASWNLVSWRRRLWTVELVGQLPGRAVVEPF
jgi:broad specificity phosphatase PhoE